MTSQAVQKNLTSTRMTALVTVAGFIGTTFEGYDFVIAALTAALIWPAIFFQSLGSLALLFSLLTFVLSYAVRPIGGLWFGHIGDRLGRRKVFFYTLLFMGAGTLLITVLPTYAAIGVAAPLLLFVGRAAQGLGYGGEWGVSPAYILEHAAITNNKLRGFLASWIPNSPWLAGLVSTALFYYLLDSYGFKAFSAWVWRVPFAIGLAVLLVAFVIRFEIAESPIFAKIQEEKAVEKVPIGKLIREAPGTFVRLLFPSMLPSGFYYIAGVAIIAYFIHVVHVSPNLAVGALIFAYVAGLIVTPLAGLLGDRIGRKKVLLIGFAAETIIAIPFMFLVSTGAYALIVVAEVMFAITDAFGFAVLIPWLSESFDAKYRVSGGGLAYNIGGVIGVVPTTLLFGYFVNFGMSSTYLIGVMLLILGILATIPVALSKDTKNIDLTK